MKLLIAALALFLAAGEAPKLGGYRPVAITDPAAGKALATAIELIHKDAALGGLDLAAPEAILVERQIVAGQKFRTTASVGAAGQRRMLRAEVWRELGGNTRLLSVLLGPIGGTLPAGAGPINGLPGGYTAQSADDAEMRHTAEAACKLLAGPAWLGRGVLLSKVTGASTQVVAGLNTHLAMRAAVKGGERDFEVVMYEPLSGQPSLSWVKVTL